MSCQDKLPSYRARFRMMMVGVLGISAPALSSRAMLGKVLGLLFGGGVGVGGLRGTRPSLAAELEPEACAVARQLREARSLERH